MQQIKLLQDVRFCTVQHKTLYFRESVRNNDLIPSKKLGNVAKGNTRVNNDMFVHGIVALTERIYNFVIVLYLINYFIYVHDTM